MKKKIEKIKFEKKYIYIFLFFLIFSVLLDKVLSGFLNSVQCCEKVMFLKYSLKIIKITSEIFLDMLEKKA